MNFFRPYDADTYEDEVDEDEVLDEEGRTRLKLRVENTIRWRKKLDEEGNEVKDANGHLVRESNARMVKWSDGRYYQITPLSHFYALLSS